MGYERYPRGNSPQGDDHRRDETHDYGRDDGSGPNRSFSGARDDRAAAVYGRDEDRPSYGRREYGNAGYSRDRDDGDRGYGRDNGRSYGARESHGDIRRDAGAQRYGQSRPDQARYGQSQYGQAPYGQSQYGQSQYGQGGGYRGGYAPDGRRDREDDGRRDRAFGDRQPQAGGRGYGRAPQGYDYDDRGFIARAGDEVRSWFGDEDAERRREADNRYDERYYNEQGRSDRDSDYHGWRASQIAALDRDYDEYRQENRSKFHNEFSSWRSQRQTQRSSLDQVQEHDEVLGSDGSHVGTVDKVNGDRILLTKNDADAGGQHHSIPSRWIQLVQDQKVTLSKTADEAKQHWRTEEKSQAMFGYGDRGGSGDGRDAPDSPGGTNLGRSFSGTY